MNEAELLSEIVTKKNELEANRAAGVSRSLLRVQEEEIRELQEIFATNDDKRLAMRLFLDTCDKDKEKEKPNRVLSTKR